MRDSQGWTQDELAEAIGVSRRVVQMWEAGHPIGKSNLRALDRLADQLAAAPALQMLTAEDAARQLPDSILLAEVSRRFAQIPAEVGTPRPGQRMVWPIALGPHGAQSGEQGHPDATDSSGQEA